MIIINFIFRKICLQDPIFITQEVTSEEVPSTTNKDLVHKETTNQIPKSNKAPILKTSLDTTNQNQSPRVNKVPILKILKGSIQSPSTKKAPVHKYTKNQTPKLTKASILRTSVVLPHQRRTAVKSPILRALKATIKAHSTINK